MNKNPAKKSRKDPELTASRLDIVLTYTAVACIALAVLSYLVTLVIAALIGRDALLAAGLQKIALIAYVGLPLGFVIIFIMLFRTQHKRARAGR